MIVRLNSHIQGDTYNGASFALTVTERDGEPVSPPEPIDLTDAIVRAYFYVGESTTIYRTFTSLNDGIVITDAENGEFDLLPNTVISWPLNTYRFEIEVTFIDDIVKTYVIGYISIVNRDSTVTDPDNPDLYAPVVFGPTVEPETSSYSGDCGVGLDNICVTGAEYCDDPWIKKLCYPYIVKQRSLSPDICFNVMQRADFFGDIKYMDLTDYDVFIYMYDENDKLKITGKCEKVDAKRGKVKYIWDTWDTVDQGIYYCVVRLKIQGESSYIEIRNKGDRFDVVIV